MRQMAHHEALRYVVPPPPRVNPNFSNTNAVLGIAALKANASRRKADTMRRKYCDQESVFAHIWDNADRDGPWTGNAETLAAKFNVSEDEARDALSELCDRGHVERLVPGKYAIAKWRERDDPPDDLPT
jgi:hypothetical protein